ncbi:hypothetical protein RhiXN_04747 [Rhizoctonia solani]|uniref:Uncharacterized protein n=1 Tax=Rhizoctonia solani TaxID=456999 RepID=A0A8H8NP50_9AGAM|nr:uncharacterized protein RhiXN_04747 [Rhizoctonia solani]QRW16745.1 hypothetical protein RhiXN_04747 [Rhizoctonia solani]
MSILMGTVDDMSQMVVVGKTQILRQSTASSPNKALKACEVARGQPSKEQRTPPTTDSPRLLYTLPILWKLLGVVKYPRFPEYSLDSIES